MRRLHHALPHPRLESCLCHYPARRYVTRRTRASFTFGDLILFPTHTQMEFQIHLFSVCYTFLDRKQSGSPYVISKLSENPSTSKANLRCIQKVLSTLDAHLMHRRSAVERKDLCYALVLTIIIDAIRCAVGKMEFT